MQWTDRLLGARRQVERLGRSLRTAVCQTRATLVYHMDYEAPDNPVIDPRRGQHILSYLVREGCLSTKQLRSPRPVDLAQLALVHDYPYLESVGEAAVLERIFGEQIHTVDQERIIAAQRRMVAGTVLSARLAAKPYRRGHPVVNLGGGLHHAHQDRGGGFCLFNDVAVAIRQLRAEGFAGRVLVLDLDLHQGDGTRRIFAQDPSVYTFSLHANDWEDDHAEADLNVALGPGVGDAAYQEALREYLPRAVRESRPELVFYLAGVDIAADDQIGAWRVSHDGMLARDKIVMGEVGHLSLVWLLAGGYGTDAWRHSARSLAWLLADLERPIPSKTDRDLRHFRSIARQFSRRELSGGDVEEDAILRPEDLMLDLVGSRGSERLLGFYSLYGLELAFESYGALPKIRRAGYPEVTFELQTDHPTGERLRVVSRDARRDVLVELVLRAREGITSAFGRRSIPASFGGALPPVLIVRGGARRLNTPRYSPSSRLAGRAHLRPRCFELIPSRTLRESLAAVPFRMLSVEWLLLQSPRKPIRRDRPLLPGQQHPGLGILREVVGMLVMMCERLGFDGLLFSPAHYHVAAQAHHLLMFVDPTDEARFAAIGEALTGVPLAQATQEVHGGGLVDARSREPVKWNAVPMVFPVSEACKAQFGSDDYDRAVQEAGQGMRMTRVVTVQGEVS